MHWLFLFSSPPPSRFFPGWTQPWLFIVYDSISNLSSRSILLEVRWFCSDICTLAFCIHRNALSRTACPSFVRTTKWAYLQTEARPNLSNILFLSRSTCTEKSSPQWPVAPPEFTALTPAFLEFISAIKSQQSTVWPKYEAWFVFQAKFSRAGDSWGLSHCLETKKCKSSRMLAGWLGRLPLSLGVVDFNCCNWDGIILPAGYIFLEGSRGPWAICGCSLIDYWLTFNPTLQTQAKYLFMLCYHFICILYDP